ncbi:c2h2-type zinc finger-containing protein [Nannochloropsis gaditana]|uniref:C2h2-type zinc finger-containing protein n=1 Tax=Nannochloropsis gaditana TaxID=72520 RepID=W7TJ83_9STRA|nr:c2h2-type zinc finger-containing protein [Nannochloropsis gaditana]
MPLEVRYRGHGPSLPRHDYQELQQQDHMQAGRVHGHPSIFANPSCTDEHSSSQGQNTLRDKPQHRTVSHQKSVQCIVRDVRSATSHAISRLNDGSDANLSPHSHTASSSDGIACGGNGVSGENRQASLPAVLVDKYDHHDPPQFTGQPSQFTSSQSHASDEDFRARSPCSSQPAYATSEMAVSSYEGKALGKESCLLASTLPSNAPSSKLPAIHCPSIASRDGTPPGPGLSQQQALYEPEEHRHDRSQRQQHPILEQKKRLTSQRPPDLSPHFTFACPSPCPTTSSSSLSSSASVHSPTTPLETSDQAAAPIAEPGGNWGGCYQGKGGHRTKKETEDDYLRANSRIMANGVFSCLHCDKTFTLKGNLKRHLFTHDGVKPFACGVCNKTFSRKADLEIHVRVHTGEKPYACEWPECGRQFARISDLRSHERTHSGLKSFVCPFPECGRQFARKYDLKKHVGVHQRHKQASGGLDTGRIGGAGASESVERADLGETGGRGAGVEGQVCARRGGPKQVGNNSELVVGKKSELVAPLQYSGVPMRARGSQGSRKRGREVVRTRDQGERAGAGEDAITATTRRGPASGGPEALVGDVVFDQTLSSDGSLSKWRGGDERADEHMSFQEMQQVLRKHNHNHQRGMVDPREGIHLGPLSANCQHASTSSLTNMAAQRMQAMRFGSTACGGEEEQVVGKHLSVARDSAANALVTGQTKNKCREGDGDGSGGGGMPTQPKLFTRVLHGQHVDFLSPDRVLECREGHKHPGKLTEKEVGEAQKKCPGEHATQACACVQVYYDGIPHYIVDGKLQRRDERGDLLDLGDFRVLDDDFETFFSSMETLLQEQGRTN